LEPFFSQTLNYSFSWLNNLLCVLVFALALLFGADYPGGGALAGTLATKESYLTLLFSSTPGEGAPAERGRAF